MKRRWRTGVLLAALAAGLVLVCRSDCLLFEKPASFAARQFAKTGHALAKHHGLRFLLTFDEPRPVEWIGGGLANAPGTECVPGRFGRARFFDGDDQTYLDTPAVWTDLGPAYTLSLWASLEDTGADQDIWFTSFQGRFTGFQLRNGQLTFFVPGGTNEQAAAYPFTSYGRFVHLAAVVEGPGGAARLYENGELKAAIPVAAVEPPRHNLEFGKTRWYAVTAPLRGALDEAAAWNRALGAKEIRKLARARQSLPRLLKPFPYWRWRLVQAAAPLPPAILRMFDRFNVLLHEGRVEAAALPDVDLHFSGNDARHFNREHQRSLASGRRTARGANFRRIHAQYEGRTVEAQAWLDGSDTAYGAGRRPGFILETPVAAPAFGARRLRLAPPENVAGGLPEIAAALAHPDRGPDRARGLCRLLINGQFKGIYYYETFDRCGMAPGERTWVAKGPESPAHWPWLFRPPPADSASAAAPPAEFDAQLAQVRRLLVNDLFLPWSSREWSYRIRQCQAAAATNATPTAFDVLGSNPAPGFITGAVDLPAAAARWPGLAWRSSRPELIAADGRVTRPASGRPEAVELSATWPAGAGTETAILHFRVMPVERKLPALFLSVPEALSSTRRVDFSARFVPVRDGDPARELAGTQGTGGGLKHRGNTSFWQGRKKPLSLRFDSPHGLLGAPGSRHLYLRNGYVDSTKMRDKFVFDLFRSFGGPDRPRSAPFIDWAEVFVNGEYFGVYEMCTRVDEHLAGFSAPPDGQPSAASLYMISTTGPLFAEEIANAFVRVYPPAAEVRTAEPLQELVAFTSRAGPEEFARGIADRVDLDNAIDFLLLLNFAQNMDGRTTNFYLGRDGAPGARFFFIPWDYDHTFDRDDVTWLSNHLFDRLERDLPGFHDRLCARWRELRQGPLARQALEDRIDAMEARLDGCVDWDLALLNREAPGTLPEKTGIFRQCMRRQLAFMDEKLGFSPAPPPAP